MARAHRNTLGDRPHHIYRCFTPEQRTANGRKGGTESGRAATTRARAKVRALAEAAMRENGMADPVLPLFLDVCMQVYSAGYRNGYQAVYNRDRPCNRAMERAPSWRCPLWPSNARRYRRSHGVSRCGSTSLRRRGRLVDEGCVDLVERRDEHN